jgi:hypothetical protein
MQAQVSETSENPATTSSLYNASLPTPDLSQLEVAITRLNSATEHSEGNNLRDAEADANLALLLLLCPNTRLPLWLARLQ